MPGNGPYDALIVKLHHEGLTPHEISKRIPRSRAWIIRTIRQLVGEEPHRKTRRELTHRQASEAIRLHRLGVPQTRIARDMGVPRWQIGSIINKARRGELI